MVDRIVLRLWSIRAAKSRDNLKFGAYKICFLLFMPNVYVFSNLYYVMNSA